MIQLNISTNRTHAQESSIHQSWCTIDIEDEVRTKSKSLWLTMLLLDVAKFFFSNKVIDEWDMLSDVCVPVWKLLQEIH